MSSILSVFAATLTTFFVGSNQDNANGFEVGFGGDFNADGYNDVLLGSRTRSIDGKYKAGRVYLIFGTKTGFDNTLDLDSLNGENGLIIDGLEADAHLGISVSGGGDINGDGVSDIVLGTTDQRFIVLFGKSRDYPARINAQNLATNEGFTIRYAWPETYIPKASFGDINGDGLDDLLIGIQTATLNGRTDTGVGHVVFGRRDNFPKTLDLNNLNGSNGFSIIGSLEQDRMGYSIATGADIDGDGIDDFGLGSPFSKTGVKKWGGISHIFSGRKTPFPHAIKVPTSSSISAFPSKGKILTSGVSLTFMKDFNGDGISDWVIGAPVGRNQEKTPGHCVVIYGKKIAERQVIDLSSIKPDRGFVLEGRKKGDGFCHLVSSGDVDGDGLSDLIISAPSARTPVPNFSNGTLYIVFGTKRNRGNTKISELGKDEAYEFHFNAPRGSMGYRLSQAHDFNNDGFGDAVLAGYGEKAVLIYGGRENLKIADENDGKVDGQIFINLR